MPQHLGSSAPSACRSIAFRAEQAAQGPSAKSRWGCVTAAQQWRAGAPPNIQLASPASGLLACSRPTDAEPSRRAAASGDTPHVPDTVFRPAMPSHALALARRADGRADDWAPAGARAGSAASCRSAHARPLAGSGAEGSWGGPGPGALTAAGAAGRRGSTRARLLAGVGGSSSLHRSITVSPPDAAAGQPPALPCGLPAAQACSACAAASAAWAAAVRSRCPCSTRRASSASAASSCCACRRATLSS